MAPISIAAFGHMREKLVRIASAVREKTFTSQAMTLDQMAEAIEAMDSTGLAAAIIVEGQASDVVCAASTIRQYAFMSNYRMTGADFSRALSVGSQAFQNCSQLAYASLPSAHTLAQQAFDSCYALASVSVPQAEYVGSYAFRNCSSLAGIDLPEASYIGSFAFQNCRELSRASLPKVEYIGSQAFQACFALSEVSLPEATEIRAYAFSQCTSLRTADLPKASVMDTYAFAQCTALEHVSLGRMSYVQNQAFLNCQHLKSISVPYVHQVYSAAFNQCYDLSKVTLPNANYFNDNAFVNCVRLMELDLAGASRIPGIQNTGNVFNQTPLYNNSDYTGDWGIIRVPESLYADFQSRWAFVSSHLVSMHAVPGDAVDAFGEGVELAQAVGVSIVSQSVRSGALDMTLSAWEAGRDGFNLELGGLTPLTQYLLSMTWQFASASFHGTSYRTGFKVASTIEDNFDSYANWPENLPRDNDAHALSMPFTAFGSKAYLTVDLQGRRDNAQIEITGLTVREATWEEAQ